MTDTEILESISALITASQYPPVLNEKQVAEMTGFSLSWLRTMRLMNEGPPRLAISPKIVRYDRDAVLAWCRAHEVPGS